MSIKIDTFTCQSTPPHLSFTRPIVNKKWKTNKFKLDRSHFCRNHDCIEHMQQAVKPLGVPSKTSGVSWGFSADATHKIYTQVLWTNTTAWMQIKN